MADSRDAADIYWVEPRQRAILPLDRFHCSRSLARSLRSGRFTVTLNQAFDEVIASCADRGETWINSAIEQATRQLHHVGHAHSIECWEDDRLVGGLYGVKLGRAFFGESMFSHVTDASKVALAWLVARMRAGHFILLDCQFMTDHLASLGAIEIPRADYAALLGSALGTGTSGSGASSPGSAAGRSPADRDVVEDELLLARPDFGVLDRLLEAAGAAGAPGPAGQFIAQLLGQTS